MPARRTRLGHLRSLLAFEALGDRTRRQIVGRLAHRSASVGELARTLPVGRPAVSMHLRVLRDAGLVSACAEGTRRLYQLEPDALAAVRDYLDWYWTQALESFKQHVEAEGDKAMQPELKVTTSVIVEAALPRAFELFIDQERWWPIATHHMAVQPGETVVLEPFVGGRWYERARDGSETDWGTPLRDDSLALVEVRCGRCGYGARARQAPPACPMCQANEWQPLDREEYGHEERAAVERRRVPARTEEHR
jgi:DNA-binding transcriptional ArsR family regulator